MVYIEAPEPHIRILWGAQFVTPYFAQPALEDWKFLVFARDICLGILTETVVVKPEWLAPGDVNVPQAADMENLMERLAPGHLCLPLDTPRPDRVSLPRASLDPLSLVHLLIVSPFLAPATVWHMMHEKSEAMGMTQRVAPFLDCLRAATVEP